MRRIAWLTPLCTLLLVGLVPRDVRAQLSELPAGRRTMAAERMLAGESIDLDGILDEAVWSRAVPAADFVQQDPDFGGMPTERTEVRIVFSEESLYMGVMAFDSDPGGMQGNTMKRDEFLSADDRFMWVMDTFLDQQTGYFFEMNPSGLMADALLVAGRGQERAWDGIWDAYVRRHEQGWTIELEIPFRTLNFDPEAPAWGINFQRTIRRKNEENLWTGHERNQGLFRLSNAGLLVGISDVTQGHGLDVKPYATVSSFAAPGATPPVGAETEPDVGVDLFYNVTPNLRANLTVNTDFAQTEVDQRLVNLTRFPLRFPEKRDFFLDGSPFFDFAAQAVEPFFSRRIGLDAGGVPQPVDVGAKLTGQVGNQDVGFLHVRTADTRDDAGVGSAGEDFTVVRLKQRVLTQSYVGSFFSRRHTRAGAATEDLYTAGADFRLATSTFRGSQNLETTGFFLWNTDAGDAGDNLSYGVAVQYPNDRWFGGVGFTEVQPNHAPAVGFTPRRGFRGYRGGIGFGPRPTNHPWIRRLTFQAEMDLRTDMSNDVVTRIVDITPFQIQFQTQDQIGITVSPSYERLERDFTISEADAIVLPAGSDYAFLRYGMSVNTASRRVLSTRSSVRFGGFFSGHRQDVSINVGVRPFVGAVAQISSEWNRIDLPEGEFQTRLHRLTLDTQLNPWIYVVNNVQYDSVSRRLGWQARFRWTVSPGNDLFVIYTQNWVDDPVGDRFFTQDRRGAAKFVYTYRW